MADTAPAGFTDAQWHVDAIADTGVGYYAVKGWRITCAWCSWEVTTPTKGEGLDMYREHEQHQIDAFMREQRDIARPVEKEPASEVIHTESPCENEHERPVDE